MSGIVDLGHWLDTATPHLATQPGFARRVLRELPQDRAAVTALSLTTHTGTHVDVPSHAILGGRTVEDYAPEFWEAPLFVLDLRSESPREIRASDLTAPADLSGAFVALFTGWDRHVGADDYHDHPYLSPDAARLLVAWSPRVLLFDTLTPEPPLAHRGPDFSFEVHRIILGAGIPIVENARGLDEARGRPGRLQIVPMAIARVDGAPCRLLWRAEG